MKTLLKLAAAALIAWATAAPALAAPPANLNITSDRGQAFSLVLDGRLLTRPVARQVHVGLLAPGRHWADISLPTPYGPPMRFRTSVWLAPGLETSYVLAISPYGPQLRQVAAVALGGPAYGPGTYPGGGYPPQPGGYYGAPGAPTPGGYNQPQGGYGTAPSAPYGGQNNAPDNSQYDNGNQGNYPNSSPNAPGNYPNNGQYGAPNPNNSGYPPAAPAAPGTYPDQGGYGAPNDGSGYYPDTTTNLRILSPTEAQDLARALRQRSFDDDRLNIAKQALAQSSVRADDLAALLKVFSFDKSRVELAKFGYAHVADPQNFYRVYDAFQFSASAREVQQAIGVPQR